MPSVTELNTGNFAAVLNTDVPVLVDFWSPSCRPCRQLTPVLTELAEENEGDAVIAKVNAADEPQLAAQFGVDMLPTLIIFNGGKPVQRFAGVQPKHKIQEALDEIE